VEALVHAAAQLPGLQDSGHAAEHNRAVDERVFLQAMKAGCRVIYVSGTSVYGPTTGLEPLAEDAAIRPADPYVAAKAEGEGSGHRLAARYGVPFTALRVSAPYGPLQRAPTVLQTFVSRAVSGEPLGYHGSGTREQTFTFVDDVADAVLRAVGGPPGVYNVAGSGPVTMKRLAEMVAEAAGLPSRLVRGSGEADPQEGFLARYDINRARRSLGWSPRVDLASGLARVVAARRASWERKEDPC
jgi:nucleoside-diphosphate-sugar epimerase